MAPRLCAERGLQAIGDSARPDQTVEEYVRVHSMARVVYIVAREQPLLCGYLKITVGARSPDGHSVEIKLDERRAERRLQGQPQDPERRRGERRLQPSVDSDLHSRGYATVVLAEASQPTVEPAIGWRRRSTWRMRAARAWRRRVWWVLSALLLAAVGVSFVVARSIHSTADRQRSAVGSSTPQPAPQIEEAPPPPPASKVETVLPPGRPTPPPSPAPMRVVTRRSSGIVLSVNPSARTLVLQDMAAAAEVRRLRVELAPDARVVLSERDDQAEDLSHPFKDTMISLSDVRTGDFVVVEMRGPEGQALARSVVVTFRPGQGADGPSQPVK